MRPPPRIISDDAGTTAVEFSLVIIPLAVLVFGIIHLGLVLYTYAQLNFATEATARCRAVSKASTYASSTCGSGPDDTLSTQYFQSLYKGATATITPTYPADNCGYKVTASVNYTISAAFVSKTIPLSSTACFPS